ncbi:MAG: hypothetical protein N3G22_02060 [Candidatus Micrarchaeota archaeon]|nr:hypothetical protein [Candidatus Micrarchaeota archaeon]
MLVLRCSSSVKRVEELCRLAGKEALILSPDAPKTKMELEAAFYLASQAFKHKKNISSSPSKEALLFLACETNFSSAVRKVGAKSPSDFLLVAKKSLPVGKLKKKMRLLSAKKVGLPAEGKKIAKYTEGELAVEKMATARIRG